MEFWLFVLWSSG